MGARYSRNTGYTISKRTVQRQPMRSAQKRITFGPTAAKFFGIAVLAILALVMLSNSSKSTTDPYNQDAIRQNISQVNQDISSLQLEAQRAQSINAITQDPAATQMQPDGNPTYVSTGSVAGVSTTKP